MFRNADKLFKKIGFEKVYESNIVVQYEKKNDKFNYIHQIELIHKNSAKHLIMSCDKNLNGENFNNAVGLTAYQAGLCIKKMKEKGWKIVKL